MAEAARKLDVAETPLYREAPNNLEAEQALLGAILVNNDAFYRVSDFLKPVHLNEPLHRKIFEVAGDIIRMGKTANPVTIKTFLPADEKVGDMTVAQYLARLAAEAVSIINAEDYGRAIYDLALRRSLITIGEDMVNIAYDAPLDMPPQTRSRTPNAACSNSPKPAATTAASRPSTMRWLAIDMAARPSSATAICPAFPPASCLDARMGGLQRSDLIVLAGRPGMGKTSLATNIAYNIAPPTSRRIRPTARSRRRTAASSASTRSKCRPNSWPPVSSPSRPKSPPRRSAAATSPRPISRSSSPARRRCRRCRSSSTRPAASRSPSSPPAPAA